jgi:ribosome recycling factor
MPLSQPTVESRNQLLANLSKQAEETRVSIRKVHQTAHKKVKTLGFDSKSGAMVDVCVSRLLCALLTFFGKQLQTLVNKRIEEVDSLMEATKKAVMK